MKGRGGLCLCLAEETIEADLRVAAAYATHVDLLELRADFLAAGEAALAGRLPRLVEVPVILTLRRARDGGRFAGSESERLSLLGRLAQGGFAYVDLEEDLDANGVEKLAAAAGARIIRSFHDFTGVPRDLAGRVEKMARSRGEIPKAAVTPTSAADLALIIEAFGRLKGREKILLGMGDIGFPIRVLSPRLGSMVCYSSAPGSSAAPGHTDPRTLDGLYRVRAISARTAVFGIVGNPVMHSLSPLIHNRGFTEIGMDAVYVPFTVDRLEPFWSAAKSLQVQGLSVTIPHKQAVVPLLSERDDIVDSVGACNTMVRAGQGGEGWRGTNTDVEGFLSPLREAFGGRVPAGLGATVIGAGGASRAVVHALSANSAHVLVLNRTVARAREIAAGFDAEAGGLDEEGCRRAAGFSDLVVQATSAGMGDRPGEDPLPGYRFTGSEIVYELVYTPAETPFLRRAIEAGCRIISGRRMLIAQACAQFRLFTGHAYPPGLRQELETSSEAF